MAVGGVVLGVTAYGLISFGLSPTSAGIEVATFVWAVLVWTFVGRRARSQSKGATPLLKNVVVGRLRLRQKGARPTATGIWVKGDADIEQKSVDH